MPRVDGREMTEAAWWGPDEALAAQRRDELSLMFPTIKHLEQLAAFADADALLEWATGREVVAVEPRVVGTGETARVVLPGEPGTQADLAAPTGAYPLRPEWRPIAPRRQSLADLRRRTFPRLLLGVLAAVLPVTVILSVLLTERAADALERSVENGLTVAARSVAARVDVSAANRQRDLEQVSLAVTGSPARARQELRNLDRVRAAYDTVQLLDLDGRVVAASRPGAAIGTTGRGMVRRRRVRAARRGRRSAARATRCGGCSPCRRSAAAASSASSPRTSTSRNSPPTSGEARLGRTGDAMLVDGQERKIISTRDGRPAAEAELVARGALRARDDTGSVRAALAGRSGATRHEQVAGRDVITGFAPVRTGGWAATGPSGRGRGVRRRDGPAPRRHPRGPARASWWPPGSPGSSPAGRRGR